MSVSLQLRSVPPSLEAVVRDAVESALDGDWAVTLSRSHLDGQWHLRLDGVPAQLRIVLPDESRLSASRLARLLREVSRPEASREVHTADRHPVLAGAHQHTDGGPRLREDLNAR